MYGHGAAPPPRSAATVISLRVLLAAAGILSCGMLACVPLFRVAVLRGRGIDWVLAWASLPLSIACFAVVGSLPESDPRTDVAMSLVLLLGLFSGIHFLVTDIRYYQQRRFAGYAPPNATTVGSQAPYGYPQPASPYPAAPVPQPPAHHTPISQAPTAASSSLPHDAAPPGPVPPPPPQRPAPARIDQVRAELDELSDYLRQHDGKQDGDREGGR
ncbi:hypothetical protein [Streptomyces sp. HUAS ZL42]|uniref:hypothetical protein n=1 Tax=Streptomyces sp. HUAS ZL42 TaxID=3231715 RepID=UPI00345EA96A